jgi:hypothetical protein
MTQSATVDRDQLAALQVLRRHFPVAVLAVHPTPPPAPEPPVQIELLEATP